MIKLKRIIFGLSITVLTLSCSVQQFAVNTEMRPFEKGGKIWGEKTEKCGKDAWELEYKKGSDLLLLGISIKQSDVQKMVGELNATSYTIETKSNLLIKAITFGMADYKIVKVIKRGN